MSGLRIFCFCELPGTAMTIIQQMAGDVSDRLAQNVITNYITASDVSTKRGSFFKDLSITCMTIIQQEIPVLRNSIDRLQCTDTNPISVVSIAGCNIDLLRLIGGRFFHPRDVRRYQPVAKIVAILVAGVIRFSNSIVGSSHATSKKGRKEPLAPNQGSSLPKTKSVHPNAYSGLRPDLGGHKNLLKQ